MIASPLGVQAAPAPRQVKKVIRLGSSLGEESVPRASRQRSAGPTPVMRENTRAVPSADKAGELSPMAPAGGKVILRLSWLSLSIRCTYRLGESSGESLFVKIIALLSVC